ncbi:28S ribosomal protein S31, mitochondrial [Trichoplax sp. H2]|nr:28S ribosomal protein S31, mitochondrial [Trichoplax sp. H2]|eukprot:RDD43413.1 28S ribosomal protein S31, mitochondrial [Trichoplax sp. H2]
MLRLLSINSLSIPCYRMVTGAIATRYRPYSNDLDLIQLLQNQQAAEKDASQQKNDEDQSNNISDLLASMKVDRTTSSYDITPEFLAQTAALAKLEKELQSPAPSEEKLVGQEEKLVEQEKKLVEQEKKLVGQEEKFLGQKEKLVGEEQAGKQEEVKQKTEQIQSQPVRNVINRKEEILKAFQDVANWIPNYNNEIQDVSQYNHLLHEIFHTDKLTSKETDTPPKVKSAGNVASNKSTISLGSGDGPRLNVFSNNPTKVKLAAKYISAFKHANNKSIRELRSQIRPINGYTKLLDNSNKEWKFPINNEDAKSDEKNVSFDQHTHLQHHLNDFPNIGSVRHFASLIITGLQQNPHLSVAEKVKHINWYKKFFLKKQDELQ